MTRHELLNKIQDYNDTIGVEFKESILRTTDMYMSGRIHHEEYIQLVRSDCAMAKKHLLPLPNMMEDE